MNPQLFSYVQQKLLSAGALDAFGVPVQMKKGRPGIVFTVLAAPADAETLARILLTETTTLGVRMRQEQRRILDREHVTVQSCWGPIRVKLGRLHGEVVNCAPEFEDCRSNRRGHRRAAQNRSAGGHAPLSRVARILPAMLPLITPIPATPLKVFRPDREIRMSEQREKFFITTPIYYVNARPHIGHTYTTVVCDAIARRQRMMGHDTLFLTGTDEHGQKIERSAAAAGKSPQQFTDEVSGEFRALWDRMGISYDQFIRTTSPEHKRGVQAMFTLLKERGYIYKGSYTGQYCVSDELYADDNTPGTLCPVCGRITETVQEENYFFKLSEMAEPLLKLYEENPGLIYPETRRNEVIAFVKGGLRDLSISRTTFTWGIPVPDDPAHVIYVWLDALCNYATAVGFGSPDPADQQRYQHYWPADVHMIGKEIVRFHCVYWPAFLLAAGLPLPRQIVAHGWLLFEESKMSKSRGNVVRSETILEVLGADALRYFLFREIVFGQDGSFSFDALVQRFNSDLANGLGNLASRVLSMIQRYFDGEVPYPSATIAYTPAEAAIAKLAGETIAEYNRLFDAFQFSRALEALWSLLSAVDKYIVETQPWAVAEKDDRDSRSRLATILYTSAEALRIIYRARPPHHSGLHRKDLHPARTRRYRQDRSQHLALGTVERRHAPRQDRSRFSTRRQERDRKDATDGRRT